MKTVNVTKNDVGRYVRVVFDDSGAQDGVITRVEGKDDIRFMPVNHAYLNGDISNNGAPIVALGNYLSAVGSGLDK